MNKCHKKLLILLETNVIKNFVIINHHKNFVIVQEKSVSSIKEPNLTLNALSNVKSSHKPYYTPVYDKRAVSSCPNASRPPCNSDTCTPPVALFVSARPDSDRRHWRQDQATRQVRLRRTILASMRVGEQQWWCFGALATYWGR